MPVVAQILARSGSKVVRDKNIRPVHGLPLMAYSIKVALAAPSVDRVIVDTDSERYAEIAREYGAETPYIRPKEMAGDDFPFNEILHHCYDYFLNAEGRFPGKVLTLLPTSPLRTPEMLERAVACLDERNCVSTVFYTGARLSRLCVNGGPPGRELRRLPGGCNGEPRLTKATGHVIGRKARELQLNRHSTMSLALLQLTNPLEIIDLDTHEDFRVLEDILDAGLYDFGGAL